MRIAIDARLNAYRQGGIPQYTRQLMTALAEVAREDQIISLQHREHLRPLVVAPNIARHTLHTPPHHRFEQWTLPLETALVRPDLLHCPDFIAPLRRPFPAVVTIHDLAFLHYPHILDDDARAYYGQVKASAMRANAVIAVSEATRQDVAQLLDVPIDQIDVIHEAAAPLYGRIELRPGEVRVLDGTPVSAGTFLLFVSTLEPRKNLPTLLRALRICLDRNPAAGYKLVVAGSRGWRDEEIFTTVREERLEDHVVFAPRVGQYDLRWLYNACRIYINPSLYEGFGLTLLEAMACGAPCLAAATSSLPEIGGEAAIYVPPLDAGLWADAIAELWDDEERRAKLARLGRVQSQRFSWTRAARETLAVYQRVVERRPRPADAPLPIPAQLPIVPDDTCSRCGAPLARATIADGASLDLDGLARATRRFSGEARVCLSCGRVHANSEAVAVASAPPAPTLVTTALEVHDDAVTPEAPVVQPAEAEQPHGAQPAAEPAPVVQPPEAEEPHDVQPAPEHAHTIELRLPDREPLAPADGVAHLEELAPVVALDPQARVASTQQEDPAQVTAASPGPPPNAREKTSSRRRRKQPPADDTPLEAKPTVSAREVSAEPVPEPAPQPRSSRRRNRKS